MLPNYHPDMKMPMLDLPLFPLQSLLFPGGLLPLRIFEVRYLDMIRRCHEAAQPFGVVCLSQGSEVRRSDPGAEPGGDGFAHEEFFPVGTLANIETLQRPQAGLMLIRCIGGQRFRVIRSSQRKFGLWVGDVELIDADIALPLPADLHFTREALQDLVRKIEQSISENPAQVGATMPIAQPYQWDDCGWIANRWSEMLPLNPELKQRFMALESPLLRLELVADTLGQMGFALPR
jgi:Lon protease-like protein